MTQHAVAVKSLPEPIRDMLPEETAAKARVYARDLPEDALNAVWDMFASALRPLAEAGKLGAILYQFPHWFAASRQNVAYLRELAERSPAQPAIEFRGAGWMKEGKQERTLDLLREHRRDLRGGGRAAGLQDVGAARRRRHLARPGDDPVPRPQRRELGEAGHQRRGALPLPLQRGRAARVGRRPRASWPARRSSSTC